MNLYVEPSRSEWKKLCARPSDSNLQIREKVAAILERVREGGDRALKELSEEIDGFTPDSLQVSEEQIKAAGEALDGKLKDAIKTAAANIRAFHEAQKSKGVELETFPGVKCFQKPVPISKVGLYIPGGTAPLFSTVLMLAIPAKIAGCSEIILCSPASKEGKIADTVLYAADICGVSRIFRVGGAQAIAAMAYGTESIPSVYKIFGPGNQWVTTAKQIVGGSAVAIDMPAGPSEVMVIADELANPAFTACDLLSQAEHGRDSQVMLLCRSREFAAKVEEQINLKLKTLPRAELAEQALAKSRFVIFEDEDDIVDFANFYAPEHLIVSTSQPWKITDRITDAGSIFVGHYTPESAGDYASGTNHTLPTSAWAHSFSGVNLDSFMRKMTIQQISAEGLKKLGPVIVAMAEAEGLQAHANAVKCRLDELQ
ncbi:MAG: histidinol dehydrogenase [Bacteroidales bacterium]|nr:histidinol dehydrogenase [Bacteroidales bacterium]